MCLYKHYTYNIVWGRGVSKQGHLEGRERYGARLWLKCQKDTR